MGKNLYCGFYGKEWVRQGEQVWLVCIISVAWGTGEVSSCVAAGPGMTGQVDSGPERESMVKEMVGV